MNRRGFNITEVIVALFILAIGFIAVARNAPVSQKGATVDKNRLTALRIARNIIDQVRSAPFGNPTNSAPFGLATSTLEGPVTLVGDSIEGNPVGFEFAVEKVFVDCKSSQNHGSVSVTVAWHQGVGQTNSAGNNSLTLTGGLTREP